MENRGNSKFRKVNSRPSREGLVRTVRWQVSWLVQITSGYLPTLTFAVSSGNQEQLSLTVAGQLPLFTEFPFHPESGTPAQM
jgi:hypothetical protein